MTLTSEITMHLYDYLLKKTAPLACLNNWHVKRWEMDIACVTKKLLLKEYEIKISRSDFLADKKNKRTKHTLYESAHNARKDQMHFLGTGVPNMLYYVCPDGLIWPDEVPKYAGLYYYNKNHRNKFYLGKPAPRIHSVKINSKLIDNIYHCMSWRLSTQLNKIHELEKELDHEYK